METITADRAIELLRDVVQGYEDFVYAPLQDPYHDVGTSCVYAYQGAPSCVVGHALARAGVPISMLAAFDRILGGTRASVLDTRLNAVTCEAALIFDAAQVAQDEGRTWGEALDAAEKAYVTIAGKFATP